MHGSMGKPLLVALLLVGSIRTGAAQKATVQVVEIGADEIRYTYDAAKLKPYIFRDLLQVSPFSSHMPPSLELCVEGDTQYRPCGNRALGADNFLVNADVNIRKGQEVLSALDRLNLPASLLPPQRYYRRGVGFWLCLERARLAYYRGDPNALRATCDGVDASAKCPDWIKQAAVAQSNADRDRLAKSEWHNCMNDAFHESYSEYPIEAWRAFLKEFGIQETVMTIP